MQTAQKLLELQFPEMRWRCLSLAADLDRIERSEGGKLLIDSDPRLQTLRKALTVLLEARGSRAERVQMLFSDKSPKQSRDVSPRGAAERFP